MEIVPIKKGNREAKVLLIGEALGSEELSQKKPFVGWSGQELDNMLFKVGIIPNDCFFTNVLHEMAPLDDKRKPSIDLLFSGKDKKTTNSEKVKEGVKYIWSVIEDMQPHLVIAMGNAALWALTGEWGITKWRGSIIEAKGTKVIPVFNPAAVLHNKPWRFVMEQDLRRCKTESEFPEIRYPKFIHHIRPNFDQVMDFFRTHRGKTITPDVETWSGYIDCIGFGISNIEAMCVPLKSFGKPQGYWSEDEEVQITVAIRDFLMNSDCVFANGVFDCQHLARQWGFLPIVYGDTQVAQHTCFPGISSDTKLSGKSLAFVSSMHCEYYCFWKDESKVNVWNEDTENQQWGYNCKDCCFTFESYHSLMQSIDAMGLREQYQLLIDLHPILLEMILRGIKVDEKQVNKLNVELMKALNERSRFFEEVLGHRFNPRSNKQVTALLNDDFGIKEVYQKGKKARTADDDALEVMRWRQPLAAPIIDAIRESRSIFKFRNEYVGARRDPDRRMRCTLDPAKVETFRLGSRKTAFGTGVNMQTISSGYEDEELDSSLLGPILESMKND